jgi:NAD-dependent dihydropyrimidine dehydrogenase PreA subunit
MKRKIIQIDEARCNGCGECIPNCREGAIKVIGGKARLVSDVFCDGLGACLGHCPQDAITIEERDAPAFDERAVERAKAAPLVQPCGCAGNAVQSLNISALGNWPVQLNLVPPIAPFLQDADLLIAADCVPCAYPGFHSDLLKGKVLLVGCPKFDDLSRYREKLLNILRYNTIKSITYAHMEVACCLGLLPVIKDAIASSAGTTAFYDVTISVNGEKKTA